MHPVADRWVLAMEIRLVQTISLDPRQFLMTVYNQILI